jgi:serine acetyltransferase
MKAVRVVVTAVGIVLVQTIVCGVAIAPSVLLWNVVVAPAEAGSAARLVRAAFLAAPAYVLFALCLMPVSAFITRVTGGRTRPDTEWRIADLSWPLMQWAHYMTATHVVRLIAGTVFRGSPVWTAYLRANGARIGRRVFVNTLSIADHNLLEFGDDVVLGADVHISGHTVEGGVVRTARVRVGANVTIGVGSIIDIDVTIGPRCQVGALTFVPKHARLDGDATYVGVPAHRISRSSDPTCAV